MHIVKEITVIGDSYISSSVESCAGNRIAAALVILESRAREFVKKEFGLSVYRDTKVIDIHDISQVYEPMLDSVLLYRLESDPHRIHVYQKKTNIVNLSGWVYNYEESKKQFNRIKIFELEECNHINGSVTPQVEMVPVGDAGVSIPIQYTVAPGRDLIEELKNLPRFRNLKGEMDKLSS